jgi:hypothetical protein
VGCTWARRSTVWPSFSFLNHEGPEDKHGITLVVKPILWLLSRPPYFLLRLQAYLAQRDSHRAEYLADALEARVAGTVAAVEMQERLLFETSLETEVQRASREGGENVDVFDELRHAVRAAPAREIERRRRVARLAESRLDDTHPPSGMRIELLERRPHETGMVMLSAEDSAVIDDELRPLRAELQRLLVDEFRSSLYFA